MGQRHSDIGRLLEDPGYAAGYFVVAAIFISACVAGRPSTGSSTPCS